MVLVIRGKLVHYTKTFYVSGPYQDNTFRYSENYYVSPQGNMGDFLNHSCEPNVALAKKDKQLHLWAIRDIAKGEEIFLDYSTMLASDDIWAMECNCGSKVCRKKIRRYTTLPKTLREKYTQASILPKYILQL